jgi:hypothetical protein
MQGHPKHIEDNLSDFSIAGLIRDLVDTEGGEG